MASQSSDQLVGVFMDISNQPLSQYAVPKCIKMDTIAPVPKKAKVTELKEEVRARGVWCQENNLSFNVSKTKEMIMDFRKKQREHPHIHIDETVVEKVESLKFLCVHITDKLKWFTHTDSVVKKAQQHLFNLSRLKKCGLSPKTLTNLYRCTIESILSGCITAWYGNCTAHKRRALQRMVRSAQRITGGK
jgi:hypothetical protein